ncbi:MAG: YbaK/EbsC family protein [Pseudomonadota bacterium]
MKGSERFKSWLQDRGTEFAIQWLDDNANTAQLASDALCCEVGQIAKSIIFTMGDPDDLLLIVTSGSNRVNERRVRDIVGAELRRPDARTVKAQTGYSIGGVPPFAHLQNIKTLVDKDLFNYATVWAAAGHPKTVFEIMPQEILRLSEGTIETVS